ncbi:septal ring lytic transglycosylase RlpA family protein [Vibrio algarum]|uniref:Endolytic peptidoglycan transglycosylase RlpA n=1 Tax=Vibrio algarum TaxID=3020714 RepID=A0ABT4YP36_9VIBR|nr:septal ring lytic transglycosylase RlpA family protein [Vibrio sp. KJ40-1]MDB1123220.1 septal ring lytic transglycosylase RlpA family protein [Vibrio sp. KJ40-1]
MKINNTLFTIVLTLLLVACSSSDSRYSISNDVGPDKPIQLDHIEDAHPVYEPFSRGGNRDYNLRGGSYKIIKNPDGFKQSGQASWYGKKFHGHLTSNGEIYDMYSMSAAHKTLPIPSYVKVTNKDNGKSTIVRINDRGPFHGGRIIDLSYAAAYKLNVVDTGTANVEIEYITTKPQPSTLNPTKALLSYSIQASSSNHEDRSKSLAQDINQSLSLETYIEPNNSNFRVLVGPFSNYSESEKVLQMLKTNGFPQAFIRKNNL